jgi:hypothetical protein
LLINSVIYVNSEPPISQILFSKGEMRGVISCPFLNRGTSKSSYTARAKFFPIETYLGASTCRCFDAARW